MEIPYANTIRPDTGFTNGKLGMYLFVASEIMFFGGLFSAYAFLRTAAPTWPPVELPFGNVISAAMLLCILIAYSCVRDAASIRHSDRVTVPRTLLVLSILVSVVFLAILLLQYRSMIRLDLVPRTNPYVALFYVFTGLHGIHVVGAVAAGGWIAVTPSATCRIDQRGFRGRLEILSMFWLLLVVLWLVKFVLFFVV